MTEDKLQSLLVRTFYKRFTNKAILIHIPNQRRSSAMNWRVLEAMGAVAGIPDLLLLVPGREPVFVEVKTSTGKLSDNQVLTHKRLTSLGYGVYTVRDVDGFEAVLDKIEMA